MGPTDTERLNWIEQLDFPGSHIWKAKYPSECGFSWLVCNSIKGNTLREAIDAAMIAYPVEQPQSAPAEAEA